MTSPEILVTKKNVILDATLLTSLMACGRFTDLRFNHRFQSIHGKSNSLEIGSLIHKALEIFYKEGIKGFGRAQRIDSAMAAAQMYVIGCKYCKDFIPTDTIPNPLCRHEPDEYPGLDNTPAENQTKPKRTGYTWAFTTLEQYFDRWKNDSWVPLEVEKVRGKILYEDNEIRVLWKAKLDLVVDTDKGIKPMDHKSAQQNRNNVSLNNQFMGQCLLMGTHGTIINKIGLQTTLKPEEKFTRREMSYSTDRLVEWQNEILPYWAYQLLTYVETGHFPPNFTHCDKYYGCPFLKVCEANPDMREEIIRGEFVVGPEWDPTNLDD